MEIRSLAIAGLLEIRPNKIEDERGYFCEVLRMDEFAEQSARDEFVRDDQSRNRGAGTITGLHFQTNDAAQGKLVRCLADLQAPSSMGRKHPRLCELAAYSGADAG